MAVALVLPLATAFNCNELNAGDKEICNQIQQSGLTSLEKDLLISDIFNPDNTFPNHDFIYSWNLDLDIKNSPNGKTQDEGAIENAWVKIIAPMPSILENGILYIPERAKLLSEYDYKVDLPSGRQRRDCKTKYYLREQEEDLDILVNNKIVGHDKLTSFGVYANNNAEITLTARLRIKVRYKIKHYRRNDNGYCRYKYSEYETDRLTLTDTINVRLQKTNPQSSFEITDKYNGITKGVLEAEDFTALDLSFQNSLYQKTNYIYTLDYALPYYILTLRAEKSENIKLQNIHVDESENKFEFVVKDASNCKIKLFSHFGSITKSCDTSFSKFDFEIKTDKLNYHENETILVEIFPKGLELNLTYADQNILAKDFTEFKAVKSENRIIAQLNTRKTNKFINVTDKKNEIFLKQLSSFSFFGYILYSFLKKYYLSFSLI